MTTTYAFGRNSSWVVATTDGHKQTINADSLDQRVVEMTADIAARQAALDILTGAQTFIQTPEV